MKQTIILICLLFLIIVAPALAYSPTNIPIVCKTKMVQFNGHNTVNSNIGYSYFFINDTKKELYATFYGNKIHGTTKTFNKQLIEITNGTDEGLTNYIKIDRITGRILWKILTDMGMDTMVGTCDLRKY